MLRALSRGSSGRGRSECGSSSRCSLGSRAAAARFELAIDVGFAAGTNKGLEGHFLGSATVSSIYAMGQRSKSVLESGSRVSGRQGNLGVGKVESRRLRKWDRRRSSLVQLAKLCHDRGVCGGRDTVDRSGQGGEDGERPRSWQEQRKGDSAQALGSRTPETMTALLASPRSDSSKFVLSELP